MLPGLPERSWQKVHSRRPSSVNRHRAAVAVCENVTVSIAGKKDGDRMVAEVLDRHNQRDRPSGLRPLRHEVRLDNHPGHRLARLGRAA